MRTKVDYRQIYIDNFGEYPRGYHIHHKDGNCHNNSPDNLEALHPLVHAQRHDDMGEHTEASMIRGLFNRNQGIAKYLQKQFYGRRQYDLKGPIVEPSRMKARDLKILKENNWVKPDDWGEKRYMSTIYDDYSNDFKNPDHSYIVDVINQLPERQKLIIIKRFFHTYPMSEIAEEMNLSERTIKYENSKALKFIELKINFKFL